MLDFKDKTYVVLEFVTIDGYFCGMQNKRHKAEVHLSYPAVIEVAAVKIKDGRIIEHFSTFVGIDGCDNLDLKFEEDGPMFDGITAEHLIGAPSFFDVAERLFGHIRGSTVITRRSANDSSNPFNLLKNYMESAGYVFNNPVISLNNILAAVELKAALSECKDGVTGLNCYEFALGLESKGRFADTVAQHLDLDIESVRQDSLTRALIMARLFIELTKDKTRLQPIDAEDPF